MKNPLHFIYLAVLYIAISIVNGVVLLVGAKPKLIKNKLLLGSIILTMIVVGAKKAQAQRTCYKVSINNNYSESLAANIDEMPSFPGGQDSCDQFIKNNLDLLEIKQTNIQGTVHISFNVEYDGSLTNIKVIQGIGSGCDEEALRVVKLMPKWIPGKYSGKKVRVLYDLPVVFKLK